ncbi:queuosine precursor transporter [Candidatus Saccharibacteria bacterium]|nr:queuosine precursor transporter [Candidatus Saccharibacteria bacterium]
MKDLKKIKIMLFLTALSASILVISNIVAVKLWDFCGIAVDGGIAIFPLSYIIGDVVMELYGKKIGDHVVFVGFLINILAVLVFLLVGALPEYPGWGGQESYNAILGFTPRIVIGSLAGYITSGLVNNFVFTKIKKRTGEKYLFVRSLGSSLIARVFDILLFDTIAFLGVLSFSEFCSQVAFAYGAGIVLEILLTPLTYLVVKVLKKYEIRD